MDNGKILQWGIIIVIAVIAAPFVMKLMPKAITFERAQEAFTKAALPVTEFTIQPKPINEAAAMATATIGTASVEIYQYDSEGPIARYTEYQKKDPGQAVVEAWNLAQSLGAAVRKETPTRYARRGMFLIIARGDDTALLDRIIAAFNSI